MRVSRIFVLSLLVVLAATFTVSAVEDKKKSVHISACLPNPKGKDSGNEWVEVTNGTGAEVDLAGWTLQDKAGGKRGTHKIEEGKIEPGKTLRIKLPANKVSLNQTGDTIRLLNADGKVVSEVQYNKNQVKEGEAISFVEEK